MKLPDMPRDGVPVQKTMVDVINYLRSITVTNVIGGKIKTSSSGTTLEFKPGKRSEITDGGVRGAFYTRYTITEEGETQGDTMLQGGTVTGGNGGSATVADYKVLDPDTGVGTLADEILYLQVACTATVEDGLLMPGCSITTATLEHGATVPDNHTFTVAAASGNIYLEVGRWTATTFLPSGPPGNVLAGGCIGNFSLLKVT